MSPIAISSASFLAATTLSLPLTAPVKETGLVGHPAILAAFITAGVGLTVFGGTQWVLHCREKTSLLLEKLEALYLGLSRLSQLGIKRAEYFAGNESIEGLMKIRGTRLTDEISMFQSFHFTALKQPIAVVMKQNGKVLELLGGSNRAKSREILNDEILELMRLIALASTLICEEQDTLTKARWYHYLPGIRALKSSLEVEVNS
jgi:hypothetical protein